MERAPSDLFLCILYGGGGGALRSVTPLSIWGPQVSFSAYYMEAPSGQFLRLPSGGPFDKYLRILYGQYMKDPFAGVLPFKI